MLTEVKACLSFIFGGVVMLMTYFYYQYHHQQHSSLSVKTALIASVMIYCWLRLTRHITSSGASLPAAAAAAVNRVDMSGKLVIVTGGNTGIGKESALAFASMHADVIIACRDIMKGIAAVEWIKRRLGGQCGSIDVIALDLSNTNSIRCCCKEIMAKERPIHVLMNNAGLMKLTPISGFECATDVPAAETVGCIEMQMQVNHLGHFLFTLLLLPAISASNGRIINVSSEGHRLLPQHMDILDIIAVQSNKKTYSGIIAYAVSKTANIMFTNELHRRVGDSCNGVKVFSVHPGCVNTEIPRYSFPRFALLLVQPILRLLLKTPEEGARTQVYCATSEDVLPGHYYIDFKQCNSSLLSNDVVASKKLWEWSIQATGIDRKMSLDNESS